MKELDERILGYIKNKFSNDENFDIEKCGRQKRSNTGKADLIIRDVETLGRCTCNLNNGTKLKPGESRTIEVSLPAPAEVGKTIMASINIKSNDPVRPFRENRVQLQSK